MLEHHLINSGGIGLLPATSNPIMVFVFKMNRDGVISEKKARWVREGALICNLQSDIL